MIQEEEYDALLTAASSTAGSDNWKTSSGRLEGPDDFVFPGDAFRLARNSIRRYMKSRKISVCPVCMDDPKNSNNTNNGWYTTKSCNHTVCLECLRSYASSLISDQNHSGPLKCPCCPRLLRVEDAKVALSNPSLESHLKTRKRMKKHGKKLSLVSEHQEQVNNSETISPLHSDSYTNIESNPAKSLKRSRSKCAETEEMGPFTNSGQHEPPLERSALDVLQKWDRKVRDDFLRSMPDFRPCPHCSEDRPNKIQDDDDDGDSLTEGCHGGGFISPECLAPIYEERESTAERIFEMAGSNSSRMVILACLLYYSSFLCRPSEAKTSSLVDATFVALFEIALALVPFLLIPIGCHLICLVVARLAKREITRPIEVNCPCCNKAFNLQASSEFNRVFAPADAAAESATQKWKNNNTRPCPGCASPIMKDGGCNHVRCGNCRVNFCWACMQTRTKCQAYRCRNGAPYGNAPDTPSFMSVTRGGTAREQAGMTLMERIDQMESRAQQSLRFMSPSRFVSVLLLFTVVIWAIPIIFAAGSLLFLGILPVAAYFRRPRQQDGEPSTHNNSTAHTDAAYTGGSIRLNFRDIFQATSNLRRRSSRVVFNEYQRIGEFRTEEDMMSEAIARSLEDR